MKKLLLVLWLLVPVAVAAYHYGPGQARMLTDDAGRQIRDANELAKTGQWQAAIESYDSILQLLPKDRVDEMRQVRLARSKAQMYVSALPSAHQGLGALVDEMAADTTSDPEVLTEARAALANAQYYMTWLMRLEGHSREVWGPEVDAARQTYKLLAENSTGEMAGQFKEDLESTIRLARMDLGELQGLPLPSQ